MRKPSNQAKNSAFTPHYRMMIAVLGSAVLAVLLYLGVLRQQPAAAEEYPIQGFDVSHHQGDVQWQKISPQKYAFVYLKATEGGDFKDRKFQDNWLKAREHGFLVGAYHFYRLCRDGTIQAEPDLSLPSLLTCDKATNPSSALPVDTKS